MSGYNSDRMRGIRLILKDTGLFALAGASSVLVPFVLLAILARLLPVADFASYILVLSAIAFITPLIGFGSLNPVGVRFFTRDLRQFHVYLSTVFWIVVASGAVLLLLNGLLIESVPKIFAPGPALLAFAIAIATLAASALLFASVYVASVNAYGYCVAYLCFGFVLFTSTLGFSYIFGLGLLGACLGISCAYLVFVFVAYHGSPLVEVRFTWSRADASDALSFGFPLMFHSVSIGVISQSDRFAISKWVGAEGVAAYGLAAQFGLLLVYFFHSVNKVVQPRIFVLLRSGDTRDQQLAVLYVGVYCMAVVLLGVIQAIAWPIAKHLLLGDSYRVSAMVAMLIVVGGAFNAMYLGLTSFVFFGGRTAMLSLITVAAAIVYLILLNILTPKYGLIGVAFSFAAVNALLATLTALLARRCTKISWLDRAVLSSWRGRFVQ
jgi:O-antigen/teichoic acid export membrane protein